MKVASAVLYRYRLPLTRTLILRNQPHIYREGLLLCLTSDSGQTGWGEIAPLPGHSRETLQEAQAQASGLLNRLVNRAVPSSLPAISSEYKNELVELSPSVRCGIEAALLHLHAEAEGRSIRFLDDESTCAVPLNGLLAGDESAMLERVNLLVNQGYRAIKLKLGQRAIDDDVALVYRIHARLNGQTTLRLDANRSWTYEQAVAFGQAVEPLSIEYIEEPLQNASGLTELAGIWNLPIALDETLVATEACNVQPFDNLKAFVLKPTLLGGFDRTLTYVRRAQELGLKTIVSSSFESAIGLTSLAHFAAQIAPDTPCGLDTSDWFKENLLEQPLQIVSGRMQLDTLRTLPTDIRRALLVEVGRA